MPTGDLVNNVRKLKTKLKSIKYQEEIDVNDLRDGSPTVFLPIFHHAFTSYSPAFSEHILGMGIEMFGKSDARFMEAVYKVLRDLFSYKPPITKEQFFGKGYAERKVIMCTEILQFIIDKNKALNPAPSKTALKTSVRPKSAVECRMAVPKTKRPSTGITNCRNRAVEFDDTSPRGAPQVVNELTMNLPTRPVRHVSSVHSHSNITRHVAGNSSVPVQCAGDFALPQPEKHVSVQSPPFSLRPSPSPSGLVQGSPDGEEGYEGSLETERANYASAYTPSISRVCNRAVAVVRMPRGPVQTDMSILDIQAPAADSILQSPVPKYDSSPDINKEMSSLYQTVETLTEHVMKFDTTLKEVQASHRLAPGADPYIQGMEQRIQSQLEELKARLVLMENRVSLVEYKLEQTSRSSSTAPSTVYTAPAPHHKPTTVLPPSQPPDTSFAADLQSLTAKQVFHSLQKESSVDFSLNFSPIRKATNGVNGQVLSANEDTFALETEDDARRSSTPTGGNLMDSLCCNFNDTQTNDAVQRMKTMMKETKAMLSEAKTSPPDPQTSPPVTPFI